MYIFAIPGVTRGPSSEFLSARDFAGPMFQPPFQKPSLQRIKLCEIVDATIAGCRAVLVDISLSGVLVEHEVRVERLQKLMLSFGWRGDDVDVECEVVRTESQRASSNRSERSLFRSGLRFVRYVGASRSVLKMMITDLVERSLDERRANARGVPPATASYAITGKIRGYLRLRLVHGTWQRVATGDPIQPSDGFTVSVDEHPAHIELLCQTYVKLSEADRELMRKMAALSVSNANGVATRRYDP